MQNGGRLGATAPVTDAAPPPCWGVQSILENQEVNCIPICQAPGAKYVN